MLYQEAVIWKRLKHINVVPFTGVTFKPLQIVSEWMPGGDLTAYIKSNPHVSRVDLVSSLFDIPPKRRLSIPPVDRCCRRPQLPSPVRGRSRRSQRGEYPAITKPPIAYPSNQPNIMVDAHSRARITDFGLARDQGASEETHTTGGTARWTAPEILEGNGTSSKEADVFGFAMVMVEVSSGDPSAIDH